MSVVKLWPWQACSPALCALNQLRAGHNSRVATQVTQGTAGIFTIPTRTTNCVQVTQVVLDGPGSWEPVESLPHAKDLKELAHMVSWCAGAGMEVCR